jgi:hypothetical protein
VKARRKNALIRVDLTGTEASLLAAMLDDFGLLLDEPDPADPVIQRLYPDGYTDDDEASQEYRELVESDLGTERSGRLQACRAELPEGGGRFELDAEAADRWLRVLNDLRLALGTRLEITEDSELDETDPSANIYSWLTAVQDTLILHVMD